MKTSRTIHLSVIVGLLACLLIACQSTTKESATDTTPHIETDKSGREPFEMNISSNKTYKAILTTDKGEVVIELFADAAPITVNNFVNLAREGFYNDTTFHRVIPGFMAQGGDPTGTGSGGPGYTIPDETKDNPNTHAIGALSMANKGVPDTGGSQFFIIFEAQPHLDGAHTVFGKVTDGMEDVVLKLSPRDPSTATEPGNRLISVEITES